MLIREQMLLYGLISENLLYEGAVNDFNRLISRSRNLLVILAGSPRAGKSWVVDNYIANKVKNLKIVNPDDISLMFTKDPNRFKMGSVEMSKTRAEKLVRRRKDSPVLVYDYTGSDVSRVTKMVKQAKESDYRVIVINVFAPLKETLQRNKDASRQVDQDYLVGKWKMAQSNISKLDKSVKPDNYYIVINSEGRQVWYAYKNGKMERK